MLINPYFSSSMSRRRSPDIRDPPSAWFPLQVHPGGADIIHTMGGELITTNAPPMSVILAVAPPRAPRASPLSKSFPGTAVSRVTLRARFFAHERLPCSTGKDATAIFRSFKHSEAAKHSLWDYTIGALDPNDYLVEEDHRCIAEIEAVLSEPGHSEQTYEAARRCASGYYCRPQGTLRFMSSQLPQVPRLGPPSNPHGFRLRPRSQDSDPYDPDVAESELG